MKAYEIAPEGTTAAEAFGVAAYPIHILIDKVGNIAHFLTGYQELAQRMAALADASYENSGKENTEGDS